MDRGILMKPSLIVATMKDLKTETRRLRGLKKINKEPDNFGLPHFCKSAGLWSIGHFPDGMRECLTEANADYAPDLKCPYGVVGDRLYIKEARCENEWGVFWRTDGSLEFQEAGVGARWTSPLYMKKECARTWLKIIGMSLERLQEITEDGAKAEGIEYREPYWLSTIHPIKGTLRCWPTAEMAFEKLWDSINPDYLFSLNPWVWVPKWKREE